MLARDSLKIKESAEKTYTDPFNLAFFMLLIVKYFEILPKHN